MTVQNLALLEKQGKTKYWLYKQLGMSYQNFSRMINNETKSIRYENIETIWNRWYGEKTYEKEWWLPKSPYMQWLEGFKDEKS